MRVLITGGTGFIGAALTRRLIERDRHRVRIATREPHYGRGVRAAELAPVAEISGATDWRSALAGVEAVVHLAARVHVEAQGAIAEFRRINVDGTCSLARQAAAAGVKRLIFVSSVKIHGEGGSRAYREDDPPRPQDAYAISKFEAEQGLQQIAAHTGIEVVVIRPPLVYGPDAKANFRALMRAIEMGIPLPFGAVRNRRSLVALDNLVDFIDTCIDHPAAAGEAFLVSDGEDLSTAELIRRLAGAMRRPARLIPMPPVFLTAAATVTGRRAWANRLLTSLQVDIAKARDVLGWKPVITVEEGLRAAAVHGADGRAA